MDDEVIDDRWFTISHDGGQELAGARLHYIDDRAVHGDRWVVGSAILRVIGPAG